MDEWESVRSKIRELEGSFLGGSAEVRSTVETVSVADFWKRRYEEEKMLWEEKLAAKEKEQALTRVKYEQEEQGIRDLDYKVKFLEQRLDFEKKIWEERSKAKAFETELEKKRVEWEARIRAQDEEIGGLRSQLRNEEGMSEEEAKRRQQLESEREKMLQELAALKSRMEMSAQREQEKIGKLEAERQAVQKDLETLQEARKKSEEKSASIEKELSLLTEERDRHFSLLAERQKENFENFENLTRGFVHRVRNHLSIMSGTVDLAIEGSKGEDPMKQQLSIVGENAKAVLSAVEEFMALSCIPEMNLQPANANEFLIHTIHGIGDVAKTQKVSIEQNFAGVVPMMPIDSKLLGEGLRQVMLNAIEASPSGSKVTVSSSFDRMSRHWIIEIADKGPGIVQSHLRKIFQPYFTTKKGRKGLGLCTAKRAVSLHHGSMSIASVQERGTTVTLRLPQQESK